ncbi:sperm-associated antigen 1 [Cryptosporidium felis]|nr:sperm-associated antigen 1 [Cryptosporidium felis]
MQALSNRSASYIKLEQFNEGLSDCNQLLLMDDSNVKGMFRRATCLIKLLDMNGENGRNMNNIDNAIGDLKKALYIEKNDRSIKELLSLAFELKNKQSDESMISQLPSEMLKAMINLAAELGDGKAQTQQNENDNFSELLRKWSEFYQHLLSNGAHDIVMSKSCCRDLIFILERFCYVPGRDSSNVNRLSMATLSWRILSFVLRENDFILSDLVSEEDGSRLSPTVDGKACTKTGPTLSIDHITFDSSNKDLNQLRALIRNNSAIINYEKIGKILKNNYGTQLSDLESKVLIQSIFDVLISINLKPIDLDHLNLITFVINEITTNENTKTSTKINKTATAEIISFSLRNLSIYFQFRKLNNERTEALEYSKEIKNLIGSLFSLCYFCFQELISDPNPSSDFLSRTIHSCEFILIIIFSLLSDKDRSPSSSVDINSISSDQFITKYLLKTMINCDCDNTSSVVDKSSGSSWIVSDFTNFLNGLVGIKILHFSNREVLKGIVLGYPQIIHCVLLLIITNFNEYNSILNYSVGNYNNTAARNSKVTIGSQLNEESFNSILKPLCVEALSFLMEFKEIRKSLVREDDTIVLLFNICKDIISSNYDQHLKGFSKMETKNKTKTNLTHTSGVPSLKPANSLSSCCKLLNGISKSTVENPDILDLFICQFNIIQLLEKLFLIFFFIFKGNDGYFGSRTDGNYDESDEYWSCIQNSFEIFTIMSMHKSFKLKLLNYKMSLEEIKMKGELLILNILNIPEIFNFHKSFKNVSNSFLYLYVSFIQNLLTSNASDPSSEGSGGEDPESNSSIYFLKRQRYYGQYSSENHVDFDQSQLQQLEMMYKSLPEYTKNERNGHYDRGDESLSESFRKLIIEETSIVNFMYLIMERGFSASSYSSTGSTKKISLSLTVNIANNIVDLVVNKEEVTPQNSKIILSNRGIKRRKGVPSHL